MTRGEKGELVVKVMDFCIAKLRESARTPSGMLLGTPRYMSAEQVTGMRSNELDARSDVYSLGVVAYEMLTGRLPFQLDTPAADLCMHMLEEPPAFRIIARGLDLPPGVEAVVVKALKKDRHERYQTTLEFAGAFASVVLPAPAADVGQPLPSTKVAPPPPSPEPPASTPPPAIAQAKAEIGGPTPPPAPPERIAETPSAPPQTSPPVAAATLPSAVPKPL